jgi:AraC-like DNA-binding protein
VICGFLGWDHRPFNPMLESLPRMLHLQPKPGAKRDRVAQLVDLALAEVPERQPGSRCVLLQLSELLFVEVVLRYLGSPIPEGRGWFSALGDPIAGHALALLHTAPADEWSLERLARAIGVSRSLLAERFTALIGQPPMRYLARWRMQLACRILRDNDAKISAVAQEVGYHSEAAFSRAFKALLGTAPATWRARSQTTPRTRRS